jgi:hypothetical protein
VTLSVKHAFQSSKGDPADTTLVRPSNWNAEHTLTAAANKILGAITAGAVTEIDCTAAGRALLDDAAASNQRTTLGLGALATLATVGTSQIDADAVTYAKIQNVTHGKMLGRFTAAAGDTEEVVVLFGDCRLTKVSTNLVLSPYKGNRITINSLVETIPDAGVTLAAAGTADTLGYIYVFMNSTTMTLESSATAPAVQAGTGVYIKTGDATRTLVGMTRPTTGPAWTDSATQRFVRSWFNDRGIDFVNRFTADRTVSNTSYTEVNSEIRCEFLAWSGEVVSLNISGMMSNSTNNTLAASIGIDDANAENCVAGSNANAGTGFYSCATGVALSSLSEGYHYATLIGKSGSGTLTFQGGTAGNGATLYGSTRGI